MMDYRVCFKIFKPSCFCRVLELYISLKDCSQCCKISVFLMLRKVRLENDGISIHKDTTGDLILNSDSEHCISGIRITTEV